MSHIVVYESADGASGFERCASLDAAIVAAERLRNVEGVASPRIFKLEEVKFDFRPYFRVEVDDADVAPTPVVERTVIPEPPASIVAAASEPLVSDPDVGAIDEVADADDADDVEEPAEMEAAVDPFADLEAPADTTASESTDDADDDDADETVAAAPVFEPEAELEAIFATDPEPEPVPENTGEALFDSLQDEATDWAGGDSAEATAATAADEPEEPVVDVPEPDSMVSVRKGLFGR